MKTLELSHVKFYAENGYLLPQKKLLPENEFKELKEILREHLLNRGQKRADEMDTPHFEDQRLMKYLLHSDVLDVIEDVIGPNIGLWSSHFICKEPYIGRRTPWHEDSAYWNGRFDRLDKIVTIWLSMDGSDLGNGCMGVVPGTHTNGFSKYKQLDDAQSTFQEEISDNEIDTNKVVWFELKEGNYSLHDGRIIHGAGPNTGNRMRCGYTMRYFALDMKLNMDHPGNKAHKIFHCRGENIASNPLINR